MRKGAALAAAMMVGWLAVLPVVSARAGTYDVVSCAAPGGDGVNRAWTLEGYNTAGKGLPEAGSFAVFPGNETCLPASGLSVSGTAGPGVAELMKEAGLTHGGFYKHFGSRDDLVAEAVERALRENEDFVTTLT